jgi:N-methylhydantoinase B
VPCELTVDGDRLIFDYEGAAPQTNHFFNTKPYIILSELAVMLSWRLAPDLPFNEGIFAPLELRCPEGTVVNALPPAPISAAHMHIALNAADVAVQAFTLALAASPAAPQRRHLVGPGFESAIGNNLWSWTLPDGTADAYLVIDGNWVGGSAGCARDGLDLGRNLVGTRLEGAFPDLEVLESWYPLLFSGRRARSGPEGAGVHRAGGGNHLEFRPHGIEEMTGTMFGMRRHLPLPGLAGGAPGATNQFLVHRADGSVEQVGANESGIHVGADDWFEMRLPNGGGYGDPLDRDPDAVIADVLEGRFSVGDARTVYGVIVVDGVVDDVATDATRGELRAARLTAAQPPARPAPDAPVLDADGARMPLYPGVVQQGAVAYAERSGAPLAVSPDHWTDGCPVLVESRDTGGPEVVARTYLDPASGRALHTEVALDGAPRTFETSPTRWATASTGGNAR